MHCYLIFIIGQNQSIHLIDVSSKCFLCKITYFKVASPQRHLQCYFPNLMMSLFLCFWQFFIRYDHNKLKRLQKILTYNYKNQIIKMEPQNNFAFGNNQDQEETFFQRVNHKENDSLGNNSGGHRSQRDDDFDLLGSQYQNEVQYKLNQQDQLQQSQIGPKNNPLMQQQKKQPQISFYDIETQLASKSISIFAYKKNLQTILKYIDAFQIQELTRFIQLIQDLPSFDNAFQVKKDKNEIMEVQMNETDGLSSDLSAKSDTQYKLLIRQIQLIFQTVDFLRQLVDKCSFIQNQHLSVLLRQILNTQSRLFNLPFKTQQFIHQNSQFVQNQNNQQKYQLIQQEIQNSFIALFQFSNQASILKQMWYYYFSSRCINNFFRKDSVSGKLTMKMRIHNIKLLSQVSQASRQLFVKFKFNEQEGMYLQVTKAQMAKMQKQQLQEYGNAVFEFSHKSGVRIQVYVSCLISMLVSDQNSIQKKSLALKMVDKLISNTKLYPQTIDTVSNILQQQHIIDYFLKDQTHSQLLRKLPQIVKFLYELEKVDVSFIKKMINQAINAHEQFFKVVQSTVQYVSLEHLDQIFQFVKRLISKESQLPNPHTLSLIQTIVNNTHLSSNRKKKKQHATKKQQTKNQQNIKQHSCNSINASPLEQHPLIFDLFSFLFKLVQEPKYQNLYIPILCKHISLQISTLLPSLQRQLTNRLVKPKNYESFIISILEHCLKIDMDMALGDQNQKKNEFDQKQEGVKYKFINNLVQSCNLYDSIMVMLCRKRYDRNITEKCLNILVLVTKSYVPLEKGHIELLWKILGLKSTNQFQKQQFFQFIKQILKNSTNLSQQSVKHIYFQIILKLHYDWFTPKIYDCFEMLFMRLNEDGKLITYENQLNGNQAPVYHLNNFQLVGIQKFYYLYFWAELKVSKKVKEFLFKLYSSKSLPQIKQKFSYELINAIMRYMKRNPESQDHVLHAKLDIQFEQHVIRAFQFFSRFLDLSLKSNSQENSHQQNLITVHIHNVTRQALPPVKKSIQVNRNMLLKDFKQMIRKQINPAMKQIQLINKGKPLKVYKMSLKQLKIDNKNTILVQNMDVPVPKKQTQQKKLKQCKQTLQSVFGQQYSVQLLDYIAEKYMGQQLQKVCEWIMDQDKVKQLQNQLQDKKTARIEQQSQIVLEKSQNGVQILSFGQILSKQIFILLNLMQDKVKQSKKAITQKQWAVIKKIPANAETLKNMQDQLQQERVNYLQLFKPSKELSLNVETYLWLLLKRAILRKNDQFRRKLSAQKYLETFIVGKLELFIKLQVYNQQLFKQIIQLYELILNPADNQDLQFYSPLNILSQNTNQNHQQFTPNQIFEQINGIKIKCKDLLNTPGIALFIDKNQTAQKLIYILTNTVVDPIVASKLLSLLLLNFIDKKSSLDLLLTKQNIFSLILSYKSSFLKFYLLYLLVSESSNIQQESQVNFQRINKYKESYIYLREYIDRGDKQSKQTTKQWLYFLLIGYIGLITTQYSIETQHPNQLDFFEADLVHSISYLVQNYLLLQKNELIGILFLTNKLIEKVLFFTQNSKTNSQFINRHTNSIICFIEFLTKDFIFNVKGVPILTEQIIKQQFYQILLSLSTYSNQLLLLITDKVIRFGVEKRNHDHDAVDFRKNDFVGIQNLGSTCYVNSLIQQLYHTRLPYKLLSLVREQDLFELNHTFMQLYMSTKNIINIRPMIQQVKIHGQQIIPTVQQDVEQFLMSLLDFIQSCNGKSIIDSIFGGSYSEELTYFSQMQGGKFFKKHKKQHFYNITLDIKGKKTLNQALVYFFRSQTLDDKIYCEELQQKTPVVKRSFIKNFPKVLIFTLKRFQFDMENMVRIKLNDYLEFPFQLDMTQFSLDKFINDQKSKQQLKQVLDSNDQSHFYKLCGILIHSGSAETGHYYSYIHRDNKWYEFNDRIVTELNLQQKIKGQCFGGGDGKTRNAYMLFYQKVQRTQNKNQTKSQQQQIEKMQIQAEESSQIQQEVQITLPLQEQQQGNCCHHGIFLSQIPQDNLFKKIVRDQNNNFIKQRLIYDVQYRKFVQLMIIKIKQLKQRNANTTQGQKKIQYIISEKLAQIQKISEIINPKAQKPIVHFINNEMMDIQQKKDSTYDQQQKMGLQLGRIDRQNDIISDLLNQNNDCI